MMTDWLAEKLEGAVHDLERIQAGEAPGSDDLKQAPILHRWRTISLQNPTAPEAVVLAGTGHPEILSRLATTSMFVAIDPAEQWAWTLSRWYRLSGTVSYVCHYTTLEEPPPMKIWVLSDLHLTTFERSLYGLSSIVPVVPMADLAVIAGDVGDGVETSARWLAEQIRPKMPVLWVLGNHEYYGGWFRTSRDQARRLGMELGLTLLDDDVALIDGIRFVGSTLWTDYDLYARGNEDIRREHMVYARMYLNDHRHIDLDAGKMDRFLPLHAREQHLRSCAWLDHMLSEPFSGETVVITHHAPSSRSVSPQYAGDPLTPAFVSDLDDLILAHQPSYWIHGHTHQSFDYRLGRTRVLCNPRGYGCENQDGFRDDLLITIGR